MSQSGPEGAPEQFVHDSESAEQIETHETLQICATQLRSILYSLTPNFVLFELFADRIDLNQAKSLIRFPEVANNYTDARSQILTIRRKLEPLKTWSDLDQTRRDHLLFVISKIEAGDYRGSGGFNEQFHPLLLFQSLSGLIDYLNFGISRKLISQSDLQEIWHAISPSWIAFVNYCSALSAENIDQVMYAYFMTKFDSSKDSLLTRVASLHDEHAIETEAVQQSLRAFEKPFAGDNTDERHNFIQKQLEDWGLNPEDLQHFLSKLLDETTTIPPQKSDHKVFTANQAFTLARRWLNKFLDLKSDGKLTVSEIKQDSNNPGGALLNWSYALTILVGKEPEIVFRTNIKDEHLDKLPLTLHEATHLTQWHTIQQLVERGILSPEEAGLWHFFHPPAKEMMAVTLEDMAQAVATEIGENATIFYRKKMRVVRAQADYLMNIEGKTIDEVSEYLQAQKVGDDYLPLAEIQTIVGHIVSYPTDYILTYVVGPELLSEVLSGLTNNHFWEKIEILKKFASLVVPSKEFMLNQPQKGELLAQYYSSAQFVNELDGSNLELQPEIARIVSETCAFLSKTFPFIPISVSILRGEQSPFAGILTGSDPNSTFQHKELFGPTSKHSSAETVKMIESILLQISKVDKIALKHPSRMAVEKIEYFCRHLLEISSVDFTLSPELLGHDPMHLIRIMELYLHSFWNYFSPKQQKQILIQFPEKIKFVLTVENIYSPQRWHEFTESVQAIQKELITKASEIGLDPLLTMLPLGILYRKTYSFFHATQESKNTTRNALNLLGYSTEEVEQIAERKLAEAPTATDVLLKPPFNHAKLPRYLDELLGILQGHGVRIPTPNIVTKTDSDFTKSGVTTNTLQGRIVWNLPRAVTFDEAKNSLINHELATLGTRGLTEHWRNPKVAQAMVSFEFLRRVKSTQSLEEFANSAKADLAQIQMLDQETINTTVDQLTANTQDEEAQEETLKLIEKMLPYLRKIRYYFGRLQLMKLSYQPHDAQASYYSHQRRVLIDRQHEATTGSSLINNFGLMAIGNEISTLVSTFLRYGVETSPHSLILSAIRRPEHEGWKLIIGEELVNTLLQDSEKCRELGIDIPHERRKIASVHAVQAFQAIADLKLNIGDWTSENVINTACSIFQCDFATAVATFLPFINQVRNNPLLDSVSRLMGYELWKKILEISDGYGQNRIETLIRLHKWEPTYLLAHPELIMNSDQPTNA
ncbi:MAG: hypothetical protein WAU07_04955 [Microgenomates group bacterium]